MAMETSAAASAEGGIPDARSVTCCICLQNLDGGDMSTLTNCNHQYHLQCLLEWCQRSPNCPACRQQVSLKEPESQDLLDAVSYERKMKAAKLKSATVQITLADLNSSSTEGEVQERLAQYMAAMGRRYQFSSPVDQSNVSRNCNGGSSVVGTDESQAFSISSMMRSAKSWLTGCNSKS